MPDIFYADCPDCGTKNGLKIMVYDTVLHEECTECQWEETYESEENDCDA